MPRILLLLLVSCMWVGCAFKTAGRTSYNSDQFMDFESVDHDDYGAGGYGALGSAAPPPPPASLQSRQARSAPAETPMERAWEPPTDSEPSSEESAESNNSHRMIHYNGHLQLRVTRPEETIDAIAQAARDSGGYVEDLSKGRVTVRVPVDSFEATFESFLTLGDVLSRSVSAQDVTEAFTAIDLRLKTAQQTRSRLVSLLARATDEEEKIALLKQIRRVTEQIDVMDAQLRTLASLAGFSRITVTTVARSAFTENTTQESPVGMGWIGNLSPFQRHNGSDSRVELDVPEGLVSLSNRGRFIAESADGSVLWTSQRDNDPAGDADFWIDAIKLRLEKDFAEAEVMTIGGYQMLRLVEDADDGYRYLIGVSVDGRKLTIVETYYPNAEQELRYTDAIQGVIAGGEG